MRLAYHADDIPDEPTRRTASTAEPRYNIPRLPGKTAAGDKQSRIDAPDGPNPGVPAKESDVDFALGFQRGFRSNSAGTPLSDTKMLPKDAPKPSDESPFARGWRAGYVYALDYTHAREPRWVRDLLDWYFTSTFDDRRSAFGSKTAAGEWQPFPKVTDQQAQKFVEAARKIGYSISVDAAHDILMLSGGYAVAVSRASILEDVYGDVNAAGGIDVDSGFGISVLIETTDYAGWVYNNRGFKPTKADCEKMIGLLRTDNQRESIRWFMSREFGTTASRHTAGWSCTRAAGEVMDGWVRLCSEQTGQQNVYEPNSGGRFFWEVGREQADGSIVGAVWDLNGGRAGSFKINADGTVARYPKGWPFAKTASRRTAAAGYRITYGWDRYEDFATLEEAKQRIDEMMADPPGWAGQRPYTWPPEILDLGGEAPYSRMSARRTSSIFDLDLP